MCDFFFFTASAEQNTVQIFNVAFSRDGRGSSCPDDGCCYQVIVVSHVNSTYSVSIHIYKWWFSWKGLL